MTFANIFRIQTRESRELDWTWLISSVRHDNRVWIVWCELQPNYRGLNEILEENDAYLWNLGWWDKDNQNDQDHSKSDKRLFKVGKSCPCRLMADQNISRAIINFSSKTLFVRILLSFIIPKRGLDDEMGIEWHCRLRACWCLSMGAKFNKCSTNDRL
jgi:hypothetical protein